MWSKKMTRREEFEIKYSAWTGTPVDEIKRARMSNGSYSIPKIASAFQWWETGYVCGKITAEIEQYDKR